MPYPPIIVQTGGTKILRVLCNPWENISAINICAHLCHLWENILCQKLLWVLRVLWEDSLVSAWVWQDAIPS